MQRQSRLEARPPWIKGTALWIRQGREEAGVVLVVRKVLGKAVDRNRLKRRLRSLCRDWEVGRGSLVVVAQSSAMRTPYRDLDCELRQLTLRLTSSNSR